MIMDVRPAPISTLPVEVTELFIQLLPASSQRAISLVSRSFYSLSIRPLYSNICLRSKKALMLCCRTLVSNATRAQTVRLFLIEFPQYFLNITLRGYYTFLGAALKSLSGLHTLRLLIYDVDLADVLRHGDFPSLRHFECHLTPSPRLLSFLDRHPKISFLQVSPNEDMSVTAGSGRSCKLPCLKLFTGNVRSLPVLCAASPGLRAAIISWMTMETDPDAAFTALARSSGHNLDVLTCRRRGWNLDLIKSASLRLPHLLSFQITNILLADAHPEQVYLQEIRRVLPRFTQLQRLKIMCVDYWENGNISCQIDQDFITVTEWGDACPSLTEISLPHSDELVWHRIMRNVWIPDPRHPVGSAWIYEGLVLKRQHTHQWSDIVDAIDESRGANGSGVHDNPMDTMAGMRTHLGDILRATTEDVTEPLGSESGSDTKTVSG